MMRFVLSCVDDGNTGYPKKMYQWKKIITKIECCGAKFYHKHNLGKLDQA